MYFSRNSPSIFEFLIQVLSDLGLLHLAERSSTIRILTLKPVQHSIASEVSIMQCMVKRKVNSLKEILLESVYDTAEKSQNVLSDKGIILTEERNLD